MSIRGLRRTFYPPNQHIAIDNSPPDKKLRLQWVHGYRGRDTHKNLWVLPSGELLYYVAAVAVLYDRDEGTQRHYTGHTEDIITYGSTNRLCICFISVHFSARSFCLFSPLYQSQFTNILIFLALYFSLPLGPCIVWTFIHHES